MKNTKTQCAMALTREVRTKEDASPKLAYLVLRNAHRHSVKSPDYLPILLSTLDHDKNGSWDILLQVISVEKWLMFHRTNHCLGCVGADLSK